MYIYVNIPTSGICKHRLSNTIYYSSLSPFENRYIQIGLSLDKCIS